MPKLVISEQGKPPAPYSFNLSIGEKISIGRASDSNILLECLSTSTQHCEIERVLGGYILRDKISTNGIKIHGELVEVIELGESMDVLLGQVTLSFELSAGEIEQLNIERQAIQPANYPAAEPLNDFEAPVSSLSPARQVKPNSRQKPVKVNHGSFSLPAVFILLLLGILTWLVLFNKQSGDEAATSIAVSAPKKLSGQAKELVPNAEQSKTVVPEAVASEAVVHETVATETVVPETVVPEAVVNSDAHTGVASQVELPALRRGVEVELVVKGMINSYQHKTRPHLTCYDLASFDGLSYDLPRFGRNTAAGVSLDGYDGVASKVTLRVVAGATGDFKSLEIVELAGLEKLDESEAKVLIKKSDERVVKEMTRIANPSPNALAYSGSWGVRMALPSEKNGPHLMEKFDVSAFAKQVSELRTVDYVIINVTQPSGPCFFTGPHPEMEKILNTRKYYSNEKYSNRGSFAQRDLLGEVLDAVRAEGKKTLVYFACEGFHTPLADEELQDVWFDHIESLGMDHYEAVRKLLLAHYAKRYGARIDGWWFDGAGGLRTAQQRMAWKEAVQSTNPKAVVAFNRMAGPPFRSSPQCDYFGGHPTPRSRHKFWEPVNLPMITANEASPWMNCSGEPVGDPKMSTLGHVFMGLQDRWTLGKCAFPPEQAIDWTTRVLKAGGMYTWSVPCAGSEMAGKQFALLKKIDKAVGQLRNGK